MIHIKQYKIFEAVKLNSNILNVLQELKDNGFSCDVRKHWTSANFSPFSSSRTAYGSRVPQGICSNYEIKNGYITYHIRLLSRQGLEFDKFQDMFDAFCSATDRLEEMGKVFKKVNARTDDNGKIKPGFHVWFVTKEVSLEYSKTNFVNLINPALVGIIPKSIVIPNETNQMHSGYIDIRYLSDSEWSRLTQAEKNTKYKLVIKKIKEACVGKYRIGYPKNAPHYSNEVNIIFKPI